MLVLVEGEIPHANLPRNLDGVHPVEPVRVPDVEREGVLVPADQLDLVIHVGAVPNEVPLDHAEHIHGRDLYQDLYPHLVLVALPQSHVAGVREETARQRVHAVGVLLEVDADARLRARGLHVRQHLEVDALGVVVVEVVNLVRGDAFLVEVPEHHAFQFQVLARAQRPLARQLDRHDVAPLVGSFEDVVALRVMDPLIHDHVRKVQVKVAVRELGHRLLDVDRVLHRVPRGGGDDGGKMNELVAGQGGGVLGEHDDLFCRTIKAFVYAGVRVRARSST